MQSYTSITIIFNPKSTGPGKKLAHDLLDQLKKALPRQKINLIATEAAGHAERLSYDIAMAERLPLIISVSGDGGYNEVINGAARAHHKGATPITGLLPAGNANDHYQSLHADDFVAAIAKRETQTIDILKLVSRSNDQPLTRYAHSYIGFGLSPKVGKKLTTANLNRFNETWIALKTWFKPHHFTISKNSKTRAYDSIIISNIDRMAKHLTLSQDSAVQDGKFEVSELKHRGRLTQILFLVRAMTVGLTHTTQTNHYRFKTTTRTAVQLDGEVLNLDAESTVTITSQKKLLRCIV